MEPVSPVDVVVMTFFGGALLVATALMPRYWRGEFRQLHERGTKGWPWGEALRRGFLRSLHIAVLGAWCGFLAVLLGETSDVVARESLAEAMATAGWVAFLLFLLALVLYAVVVLFNSPRFLVPPHAREEPGALDMWLGLPRAQRHTEDKP